MFKKEVYLSVLQTKIFGRKCFFKDELLSTNDFLMEKKTNDGELVFAKNQTCGRGRSGRSWFSYDGGLAFSLVLPMIAPAYLMPLNIAVGVIVMCTVCGISLIDFYFISF